MGAAAPKRCGCCSPADRTDAWLGARGVRSSTRRLMWHYLGLLGQQLAAMLPITLLQVLVMAIFFNKTSPNPPLEAAGLISAVFGLVLFLEGLRVAIMPMAMLVGTQLPQRLKLFWVLAVAFALGVLVTYAEPAIAALRPLAALVDPQSAPYLYFVMSIQTEAMVFSIGAGVGVAAVLGTLKFLYNWSLKIMIAATLMPTIGLACYMAWGANGHLRPLLGVAWDCGAVTTGPVTVPVLLSLGVGVMKAQKQKALALAVLEDAAINRSEGNSLEGFGIVTLASLLPILAVELMAIISSFIYPYESVLAQAQQHAAATKGQALPPVELSPVKEVVYGLRSISPLIAALVLLVVVVLRQPLPDTSFLVDEGDDEDEGASEPGSSHGRSKAHGSGAAAAPAANGKGPVGPADLEAGDGKADTQPSKDAGSASQAGAPPPPSPAPGRGKHAKRARNRIASWRAAVRRKSGLQRVPSIAGRAPSVAEAIVASSTPADQQYFEPCISSPADPLEAAGSESSWNSEDTLLPGGATGPGARFTARCAAGLRKYSSLIIAMCLAQLGMILFSLGLTFGFSALGDMTGATLPTAFLHVDYDPASPRYSYVGGLVLTMVTIFLLGILATKAEPALNVLGETVQTLSQGKFTKAMLIWSVCFGVAVGMCAGSAKILFSLPLIYFILVKYAIAGGLTLMSREAIVAVAWDSAGVTTGPVTVPYVLSIGIGFATAVKATEGFGVLTIMSVAPICSVLITSLLKQPVKAATTEIARMSKMGLQKVSRSLATGSSRGGDGQVVDFASALQTNPRAMAAAGVTSDQLKATAARPAPLGRIGEHSMIAPSAAPPAAPGSSSKP